MNRLLKAFIALLCAITMFASSASLASVPTSTSDYSYGVMIKNANVRNEAGATSIESAIAVLYTDDLALIDETVSLEGGEWYSVKLLDKGQPTGVSGYVRSDLVKLLNDDEAAQLINQLQVQEPASMHAVQPTIPPLDETIVYRGTVRNNNVMVRQEPKVANEWLAKLDKGCPVIIYETLPMGEHTWYRIIVETGEFSGVTGYLRSDLVALGFPLQQPYPSFAPRAEVLFTATPPPPSATLAPITVDTAACFSLTVKAIQKSLILPYSMTVLSGWVGHQAGEDCFYAAVNYSAQNQSGGFSEVLSFGVFNLDGSFRKMLYEVDSERTKRIEELQALTNQISATDPNRDLLFDELIGYLNESLDYERTKLFPLSAEQSPESTILYATYELEDLSEINKSLRL